MKSGLVLIAVFLTGCAHGWSGTEHLDEPRAEQTQAPNPAAEITSSEKKAVETSALSKTIAVEVLRRMPLVDDSKTLTYVNAIGQYLAQSLVPSLRCHKTQTAWSDVRVAVVKSTKASAFSLPGGWVFVTTALMNKMNSEDEFAGVVANEIALSVCGKGVPAHLEAQASTGWSEFVLTLPTKAISQADLMFADKYALVTLYRRGYDITPYVMFIAKNEISGRHLWGAERATVLQKSVEATPSITPTVSARAGRWKAAKAKSF